MDKRYQVFVSSTYADLKDERQKVVQTLMEMDCIPAGMELFPAIDEEQFEFIKKIINDCDYYLLIIGGRYGSLTSKGISYTEKEYDYAIERELKVIAFIHENPDNIPSGKCEKDPALLEKLQEFKKKVSGNKLIKFWNAPEELPGLVALSLTKTIKTFPAVGWVRANIVTNQDSLMQINSLRIENDSLKEKISKLESGPVYNIKGLAGLDERFKVCGTYITSVGSKNSWEKSLSWSEIFGIISPYILSNLIISAIKGHLAEDILKKMGHGHSFADVDAQVFNTISLQFKALGLIKIAELKKTNGAMGLFWSLTNKGEELMMQIRTIPSRNISEKAS